MAKSIMQFAPSFGTRLRAWCRTVGKPRNPITDLMSERLRMVQRGEYEPVGTILMLKTEAGWIQFPSGNGPALARFSDGTVDLLDSWEWNGLPPRYEGTNDLCPECAKAPCNECYPGDGRKTPYIRNGALVLEPGERLCTYGTQVECCGGIGVIVSQDNRECPSCEGTGKVKCRKCKGTAQVPSGYVDWDDDLRRSPSGKFCESCGGSGRVRKTIEQSLSDHFTTVDLIRTKDSSPLFEGERFYIPILALMLMTPDKVTQPWKGDRDDSGNYPHMVSGFAPGARAVIVGGVLRPDHTNSGRRRRQ